MQNMDLVPEPQIRNHKETMVEAAPDKNPPFDRYAYSTIRCDFR